MCASSVNTERYNSQSLVSTALAYRYNRAAIATSSITRLIHALVSGMPIVLASRYSL